MAIERPRTLVPRRGRAYRLAPGVLFPALAVPVWVGELHQAVWGRGGRWVGVAVGAILSTPYLVWGGVTAVLLTSLDRIIGRCPPGR